MEVTSALQSQRSHSRGIAVAAVMGVSGLARFDARLVRFQRPLFDPVAELGDAGGEDIPPGPYSQTKVWTGESPATICRFDSCRDHF